MRSVYIRERVEISSFRGGDAELAVSHLERGKISVATLDFGYYCFEYKMSP
ncbi:hypothetical protein COLO4_05979 [Corchorus olitorius]|uniref:Uncharacterized protein n=1 Tax=Corchorus olitorius TaxID=93759 RepID=A0A1R3KPC4_9ROSI|nr:hypothetical protein COLO4_05979 [Corchorus olitorius]